MEQGMSTAALDIWERLHREMGKVIVGRKKEIRLLLTALLTSGHVLLEDLPGVGKTTLVKTFAKVLDCSYRRIQCTPDLMPSDVLGMSIYHPGTGEFSFRQGPVFTHILLVDEINRALPRTQSSFLECMEERQVSLEGRTFPLEEPFMVLATQNPIETEGTFPLPEAQLDRFLFRIRLGYPSLQEEAEILQREEGVPYADTPSPVVHPEQIIRWRKECAQVTSHPAIREYIVNLAAKTRNHRHVTVGVSPRASKALFTAAKAWAFLQGRSFVLPDDVKDLLILTWNHRLVLNGEAKISQVSAEQVLQEILEAVPLPEEQLDRVEQPGSEGYAAG